MVFKPSDYIEFGSPSDFFSLALFWKFFWKPEPIVAASSDLRAARVGKEPNPDAYVGIGSQIGVGEDPRDVNGAPHPTPADPQEGVLPPWRGPAVIRVQVLPVSPQVGHFVLFSHLQKGWSHVALQISRSLQKMVRFFLDESRLAFRLSNLLIEIV